MSVANSFLVRGGTSSPFPSLSAGSYLTWTSAGLVHADTVSEFMCTSAMLGIEDSVSSEPSIHHVLLYNLSASSAA